MNYLTSTFVIFFAKILHFCDNLPSDPDMTYDRLYTAGLQAYSNHNWFQTVDFMKRALEDYNYFHKTILECRKKCREVSSLENPDKELEELNIFKKILFDGNCLRRCKLKEFTDARPDARTSGSVEDAFKLRKPYDFMHFSYYKMEMYKEAASAAYTYYLANPDQDDILSNIQYFRKNKFVEDKEFVNSEMKTYQKYYSHGVLAYTKDEWREAIDNLEKAAEEYYEEEKNCRLLCEGPYDHQSFPDFIIAIADHYTQVIECQSKCEENLSVLLMDKIDNFVPEIYHYLQFSYFKLNELEKSAECVATFLAFMPNDQEMLENKDFYQNNLNVDEDKFIPREDALLYIKRRDHILKLQTFINNDYLHADDVLDDEGVVVFPENARERQYDYLRPFHDLGLKIIAEEKELLGKRRLVTDGLLNPEQCMQLVFLANTANKSEAGVRIIDIPYVMKLMSDEKEYETSLRLILRTTEIGRIFVFKYYNMSSIQLVKTTVVCRDRTDPADDETCYEQEDGSCADGFPSEVFEDKYYAVIYLTDIPESGDIVFYGDDLLEDSSIKPAIGRMVVFQGRDKHSVSSFDADQRCAVIIELSTDRIATNLDYMEARTTLKQMEEDSKHRNINHTSIIKDLKDQGMEVTLAEKDLLEKERFVVDGLLNGEQCLTLMNLAVNGGLSGSGYKGADSPHSINELFSGLTVARATQSSGLKGDGYEHQYKHGKIAFKGPDKKSPHTDKETFEGLTVGRAMQLVEGNSIEQKDAELYLNKSELARTWVESYMNLTRPLYFDFTHLVCRTALDDTNINRTDLSHPVHSDNCMIQEDGSCTKEFPAYIQRDYSALLYLNDDFVGGDFFFAHKNRSEQVSLKPKCGRLVGFNAGAYHGVKAVMKGQRCALALWMTQDPNYKETAHFIARKTFEKLNAEREKKLVKDEL